MKQQAMFEIAVGLGAMVLVACLASAIALWSDRKRLRALRDEQERWERKRGIGGGIQLKDSKTQRGWTV